MGIIYTRQNPPSNLPNLTPLKENVVTHWHGGVPHETKQLPVVRHESSPPPSPPPTFPPLPPPPPTILIPEAKKAASFYCSCRTLLREPPQDEGPGPNTPLPPHAVAAISISPYKNRPPFGESSPELP